MFRPIKYPKNLNKMFIVSFPKLFSKQFRGLTIYPFIFVKGKELKSNKVLINHEMIHIRQQIELLWLPFFLWYITEFFIRLIQYRNAMKAYENISFEREAYYMENDFDYLRRRKIWSFFKYL